MIMNFEKRFGGKLGREEIIPVSAKFELEKIL